MRALRIAIISQYYRPENVHLPHTLARGLADRGHDVRVVTGFPNYPQGKLWPVYRQRLRHVERDGDVTVRRVPLVISHSSNPIGRFANYASFGASVLTAWRFVRDADVVYVYGAQMTAALAPSLWKKLSGKPFVVHMQDLWPESVTDSSLAGGGVTARAIGALLTPWLRSLYRAADATIAIAPTAERLLVERGVPVERSHMLLNWADEDAVTKCRRPEGATSEDRAVTRFTYAGNLGDRQDLATLLRAAQLLAESSAIRITIAGSGIAEPALRDLADELDLTNVEFVGRVPADEMHAIYATTDFQIVPLTDSPIFTGTIPSKLQSTLMAGIPVVTSVRGDVTQLVVENRLGVTCEPESPEAMAAALQQAASIGETERRELSRRCRDFYDGRMSARNQIHRLEDILRSVVDVTAEKTSLSR